jgi:hypothetical protein
MYKKHVIALAQVLRDGKGALGNLGLEAIGTSRPYPQPIAQHLRQKSERWLNKKRHCEVRSNPKLYRADLPIGDCFVPRNDAFIVLLAASV